MAIPNPNSKLVASRLGNAVEQHIPNHSQALLAADSGYAINRSRFSSKALRNDTNIYAESDVDVSYASIRFSLRYERLPKRKSKHTASVRLRLTILRISERVVTQLQCQFGVAAVSVGKKSIK